MSDAPAMRGAVLPLRVFVAAADPVAARRFKALAGRSGHAVVGAAEAADVVLSDGSSIEGAGLPTVAIGLADGDFAGLLPEGAGPAQLDGALRAVAAGLTVRPQPSAKPRFGPPPDEPAPVLTPREIEVLSAFADGLSNKEAARRLGISPHTVKFHGESLFRKLGAGCRAEAVAKGLRHQIVEF
jgi:DNA-binding CsgD family transcriptional regulator